MSKGRFVVTRNCCLCAVIIELLAVSTHPVSLVRGNQRRELTPQETSAKLDAYLNQAAAFGFSGSVLVASKGKIILHKGYGLADRAHNVSVSADSVFDIGSITKQITAAAIMKLEMQGKLRMQSSCWADSQVGRARRYGEQSTHKVAG